VPSRHVTRMTIASARATATRTFACHFVPASVSPQLFTRSALLKRLTIADAALKGARRTAGRPL
jgi:hypothetical protein